MKFTDEHRKALSEAKIKFLEQGGFHGKQSLFISCKTGEQNYAHSNLELTLMKQFDDDKTIVSWTKNHHIRIPYEYCGQHLYLPDFRIEFVDGTTCLIEAKGYEFEPERCNAKALAAQSYCDERAWKFQVVYQKDVFGVNT